MEVYILQNRSHGVLDKNNQFSMNVMKTICGDQKKPIGMVNMAQKTVKERTISGNAALFTNLWKNEDDSLKFNLKGRISQYDRDSN
jgi:hypothetical protein